MTCLQAHPWAREDNPVFTPVDEVKGTASIIIPTYNHANYISGAIQSALNQDYENVEIIVVDDGSTDNTHEIVLQFGNRGRYIRQDNHGLSAARNTGLRLARGEFVGLLDADDMYEKHYLRSLVDILENNSDMDAAYCGFRFVSETNESLFQVGTKVVSAE